MRLHFKRVVKRKFRELPERQQRQEAEDNMKRAEQLGPLFEQTVRQAEKETRLPFQEPLRYRQLDQLQRDWAIAAGKLPEMVSRSAYGSIVTLALRGKGGLTVKVDMTTGRIWWARDWIVAAKEAVVVGALPMSGGQLIEALRIAGGA